jgi:hypothetical protein
MGKRMSRAGTIALGAALLAGCSGGEVAASNESSAENGSGNMQAETSPTADAARAAPSVPHISAQIDFSSNATIADQVQELASRIGSGEVIYLDLTIIPEGEDSPNYRVNETPQSGAARPLQCDSGTRLDSRSFSFAFNPDYNHLLLEVLHGPPNVAPYSTAACVNRGGSPVPVFVVRGYYAVSAIDIPTATDVQLRPVSPTFK